MVFLLIIWAIFIPAAVMMWDDGAGWLMLAAAGFYTVIYFAGKAHWLKWLAAIAKIFRFLG